MRETDEAELRKDCGLAARPRRRGGGTHCTITNGFDAFIEKTKLW